jgi:hypothetical protein
MINGVVFTEAGPPFPMPALLKTGALQDVFMAVKQARASRMALNGAYNG